MRIGLLCLLTACQLGDGGGGGGIVDTSGNACDASNEACTPAKCGGEGPEMLPGADCMSCHANGGGEDGGSFTVAGTAFADIDGQSALSGATIHILDANQRPVDLTTNAVGNFVTSQPVAFPITASIETANGTRAMLTPQTTGACNSCHKCGGPPGGKLYGP